MQLVDAPPAAAAAAAVAASLLTHTLLGPCAGPAPHLWRPRRPWHCLPVLCAGWLRSAAGAAATPNTAATGGQCMPQSSATPCFQCPVGMALTCGSCADQPRPAATLLAAATLLLGEPHSPRQHSRDSGSKARNAAASKAHNAVASKQRKDQATQPGMLTASHLLSTWSASSAALSSSCCKP